MPNDIADAIASRCITNTQIPYRAPGQTREDSRKGTINYFTASYGIEWDPAGDEGAQKPFYATYASGKPGTHKKRVASFHNIIDAYVNHYRAVQTAIEVNFRDEFAGETIRFLVQ